MPDERFTRQRIRDHFRRLWAPYLAGIVLLFFLNNVIYDVTRPGYTEDETLKLMLLNVEVSLSEAVLGEAVKDLGFKTVECVPIAAQKEDPNSRMLLKMQMIGGYGDIWITDAAGLELLVESGACLPLDDVQMPDLEGVVRTDPETGSDFIAALQAQPEICIVVAGNGTNTQSALEAIGQLTENME